MLSFISLYYYDIFFLACGLFVLTCLLLLIAKIAPSRPLWFVMKVTAFLSLLCFLADMTSIDKSIPIITVAYLFAATMPLIYVIFMFEERFKEARKQKVYA